MANQIGLFDPATGLWTTASSSSGVSLNAAGFPVLQSPRVDQYMATADGSVVMKTLSSGSGFNWVVIANAGQFGSPGFATDGGDTNINFNIAPKGTGRLTVNNVNVPTLTSTDTLTNKTLTSPTINGARYPISAAKTANYTAVATDYTILVNATSGAITIVLPAASTMTGKVLNVKKIDSSANAVTVDPNGAETIDGAATKAISTQYGNLQFQCDGTTWWTI